jgi:DNA-binding MarR family transcriptional regulator
VDQVRWLDAREQQMWRSYLDMTRKLEVAIERQLLEHGLSNADYAVLVPLSEAPEQVIRARDLARMLGWDRSRLSHHLSRMGKRGLIARHPCDTDARGTMIEITPDGRRAVETAAPGHVETVRRFFVDQLSPAEQDTLGEIASRVVEQIGCPPAE